LRNVLIAIGNSGEMALAEEARRLLDDTSPLVRGAAVWALGQLVERSEFDAMKSAAMSGERDEGVRQEWHTPA
jgi:epoxyqueuosine reductase